MADGAERRRRKMKDEAYEIKWSLMKRYETTWAAPVENGVGRDCPRPGGTCLYKIRTDKPSPRLNERVRAWLWSPVRAHQGKCIYYTDA